MSLKGGSALELKSFEEGTSRNGIDAQKEGGGNHQTRVRLIHP